MPTIAGSVRKLQFGATVYCTWSERETFTRVHGGTAFCADCGAIDHKEVTA
jgi:hypothetical protein